MIIMIAIINKGPHNKDDPMGERTYHLMINNVLICEFKHVRGDGLSTCLRKAADANDVVMQTKENKLLAELSK